MLPWYTVMDAAKILNVPERELRRAIQDGELQALRLSPRRTFVRWDHASAWKLDIWDVRR